MMVVPESEFYQAFGRLEGKIDLVLQRADDAERRIRSLERWSWMVLGGAAVISAATTILLRAKGAF